VKRIVAEGSEAVTTSPPAFAAHIRAEHERWSRVIKQAGIRDSNELSAKERR